MTDVPVSQEAREAAALEWALPPEVQAIVDEVTAKFRQELQQIMSGNEYTCLITGGAVESWAQQYLARHRQQAERGEAWRPIETAPRDEPILAAMKVHHRNGDTWWERHVIVIDSETGTISDMDYHHGWEADDYQAWQPLPAPPEAV